MTAPTRDPWAESRERTPKPRMPRGSFPTAFLTFSLLVLVFAVGFVVGRVVIARAYVKAGPELDRHALPRAEGREEPPPALTPGQVSVPEPHEGPGATAEPGEAEAPGAESREPSQESPAEPIRPEREAPQPARPELPSTASEPPREGAETGARRYALQAGVFVSQQGARELADELTRAGYPARVEPDRSGEQTTYRVLTGRYRSEEMARREAERVREAGFEAFVVQR